MGILIVLGLHMVGWYLLSLWLKRNDVADLGWGAGGVLLSLYTIWFMTAQGTTLVVPVLIILWGARLSVYLYMRNRDKSEDFRYRQWREQWGRWFKWRSFIQVYLLQTVLLAGVVLLPLYANTICQTVWTVSTVVGMLVWLTGWVFQWVGDLQLSRFIQNKPYPGAIMQSGLWRYTRHPNYFGEILMWWGIFLMVGLSTCGWWAVISPLLITGLICFVSGIPMLEKKYAGHTEYAAYKRRTSALIPWWPKAGRES